MTAGPATHPSWATAQARERTPEPITAVMIWALAVHTVPVVGKEQRIRTSKTNHNNMNSRVQKCGGMNSSPLTSSLGAAVVVAPFRGTQCLVLPHGNGDLEGGESGPLLVALGDAVHAHLSALQLPTR